MTASLAIAASKRTKQLMKGAAPLSKRKENRPVVTALRELAEGKITLNERS